MQHIHIAGAMSINLVIVAARKNQSITNMMDVIPSVNLFYEFSPKRKWYFKKFLNVFGG